MRVVTVTIGGERHQIDLDNTLRIHNADAERHEVAADMAWWGILASAAEAQVERLTADAASWYNQALSTALKLDDKMAEWKAKASAAAHPDYLKMQRAIADAREQAGKANNVHWSLVRKMDMLRALIPGEAGDRRNSGFIGRAPALTDPVPVPQADPRLSRFKQSRQKGSKED